MISSTVEYLAVNNENRLLRVNTNTTPTNTNKQESSKRGKGTAGGANGLLSVATKKQASSNKSNLNNETSLLTSESSASADAGSTHTHSLLPHHNANIDLRLVYASLNDIDEQLNRPLTIEYFFTDDYMLDNASTGFSSQLKNTTAMVNNISPKVSFFNNPTSYKIAAFNFIIL